MSSLQATIPELDTAVANTYAVFKPYSLRHPDLNACKCPSCVSPEDEHKLITTPLREIPSKLLTQYTQAAVTWDERASVEMRYFIPRYCELIAHDEPPSIAGEIGDCLCRLGRDANWRDTWPSDEVTALQEFFIALLLDRLSRVQTISHDWGLTVPQERIDDVLALVVTAGAALSPLLEAWDAAPEPGPTLHMAAMRFNVRHYDDSDPPRLPNGFFDRHLVEAQTIARFVLRDEVASRIEAAFFATDDKAQQDVLSTAVGPLWGQPGARE